MCKIVLSAIIVILWTLPIQQFNTKLQDKQLLLWQIPCIGKLQYSIVWYDYIFFFSRMLSPYSMDEYAWTRQQAVLYNSILISSTAFIILVMYVVIAFVIKW